MIWRHATSRRKAREELCSVKHAPVIHCAFRLPICGLAGSLSSRFIHHFRVRLRACFRRLPAETIKRGRRRRKEMKTPPIRAYSVQRSFVPSSTAASLPAGELLPLRCRRRRIVARVINHFCGAAQTFNHTMACFAAGGQFLFLQSC